MSRFLHRSLIALGWLAFAGAAFAEAPRSEFSSTKKGVYLDRSTEPDYFTMRCKGLGGYELILHGDDARSWLDIKFGKSVSDLREETFKLSPGTFPSKANDVVEWRGVDRKGSFQPYAIIYRLQGGNDETRKIKTRLIVIHLNKGSSKVIGYAEGKDEDAEARRIADRFAPASVN